MPKTAGNAVSQVCTGLIHFVAGKGWKMLLFGDDFIQFSLFVLRL